MVYIPSICLRAKQVWGTFFLERGNKNRRNRYRFIWSIELHSNFKLDELSTNYLYTDVCHRFIFLLNLLEKNLFDFDAHWRCRQIPYNNVYTTFNTVLII